MAEPGLRAKGLTKAAPAVLSPVYEGPALLGPVPRPCCDRDDGHRRDLTADPDIRIALTGPQCRQIDRGAIV